MVPGCACVLKHLLQVPLCSLLGQRGLCYCFYTGPRGCPVGCSSLQLSHSQTSKFRAGLGLVLFSVQLSSRKFKAGPAWRGQGLCACPLHHSHPTLYHTPGRVGTGRGWWACVCPGHCPLCQDVCLKASTQRTVSRLMPWAGDEPPAEGLAGLGAGGRSWQEEGRRGRSVLRHQCPSN